MQKIVHNLYLFVYPPLVILVSSKVALPIAIYRFPCLAIYALHIDATRMIFPAL